MTFKTFQRMNINHLIITTPLKKEKGFFGEPYLLFHVEEQQEQLSVELSLKDEDDTDITLWSLSNSSKKEIQEIINYMKDVEYADISSALHAFPF